jgi:glycosyltransferase involved in cell wall biosynthesis
MWRNRHQLMTRLARNNRVIYVDPAVMLRPALRRLLGGDAKAPGSGARRVAEHESGVLVYHSPWWTPLTGRSPFADLSIFLFIQALRRSCGIDKRCRPIIWLSRPHMHRFIGKLREKMCIYHVVDEYAAYAGIDSATRDLLRRQEQTTAERADAVIVVTPVLMDSKSPYNERTYLVPNAVDYASYTNAQFAAPDDLAALENPVIGFTGLISVRLDFELIQGAAEARPGWSFVFVGAINDAECRDELRALEGLDNIHFLGIKPVELMPAYLQNFDVCTIPYAADDSAANASPLKLYEYAAVGKPIVTTDFAAASAFPGHLVRVTTAAEFVRACERALSLETGAAELVENRRFAETNTWDNRVDDISEIMRKHIGQ